MPDESDAPFDRFLTLDEVATVLRVEVEDALALVERGELAAIRVGRSGPWRVETRVLEAFIDDQYELQRRLSRFDEDGIDDLPELWGGSIVRGDDRT
ncbi:helix-turn-helix domain-containing protein [Pseudoclavibacter chungangensis]|uniref:Helix-turn-helix domain-containing protein n=1 Tax=Pseudoclavibacter chungangensis TaxID=587635 RepID=A0A7J5BYS6_9MICO|nr:helix-turn-helix domain-containing protein [Pseudoclavibacter chungangensis]KAB1659506.1 helix-turn-helix domain-containing protein [Pseudoclavibacter chungangensis]NYJ67633.1 excisionase family DNA binding protein [Pseudoclavibacter chungangensis]